MTCVRSYLRCEAGDVTHAAPPGQTGLRWALGCRQRLIKATRTALGELVLNHLDPASALAFGLLSFALVMVIMFEATNGFHDAANAVATVIYTKSLQAGHAVF